MSDFITRLRTRTSTPGYRPASGTSDGGAGPGPRPREADSFDMTGWLAGAARARRATRGPAIIPLPFTVPGATPASPGRLPRER